MTKPKDSAYPNTLDRNSGLTKREYFAAMILGGILSSDAEGYEDTVRNNALRAVHQADELIKALNEERQ